MGAPGWCHCAPFQCSCFDNRRDLGIVDELIGMTRSGEPHFELTVKCLCCGRTIDLEDLTLEELASLRRAGFPP